MRREDYEQNRLKLAFQESVHKHDAFFRNHGYQPGVSDIYRVQYIMTPDRYVGFFHERVSMEIGFVAGYGRKEYLLDQIFSVIDVPEQHRIREHKDTPESVADEIQTLMEQIKRHKVLTLIERPGMHELLEKEIQRRIDLL